jgi:Xaa-Pro aminopeptidase
MTVQASGRPSARLELLERRLAERGLDSLLVTHIVNVRYLSGFTGTNGACVVTPGARVFITDFRYVEQAEQEVGSWERVRGGRDLLADAAERVSGRVGFEDRHLAVRQHERLRGLLDGRAELVPAGDLIEEMRAVKDERELAAVRAAAELGSDVLERFAERGFAGRTERQVALELDMDIRGRGGEPAFPTIVAAGAHGALPHATPREASIAAGGLVIIDMGCTLDGYCSDCTRTFASGPPAPEAVDVYELVRRAQEAGLAAARAGAPGRDVDAVARTIIEDAGYGEQFGHGLGHGVGLEVHEEPRLAPSADAPLEAGNVVTVEPGVYLPGRFGVRIEDLVAVTGDGCEVLTSFRKDLLTLEA